MELPTPPRTALLKWRAPARTNHRRSERWYLIAGLIAATGIVYGLIVGAWTMSLVLALVSGLYYLVRNHDYRSHTVRIFADGVEFDERFRRWDELKNFWILQGPTYCELHIAPARFGQEIVVQTGQIDPYAIRDTLIAYLPQDGKRGEHLLDAFIRFCKL